MLKKKIFKCGEFFSDEYFLISPCFCAFFFGITVSPSYQTKFLNVPWSLYFTMRFEGE